MPRVSKPVKHRSQEIRTHKAVQHRIAVIVSQLAVRQLLENHLEQLPQLKVIGGAGDVESAIRLCAGFSPDIVLVEVRSTGLRGMRSIATRFPQSRIVIFSECPSAFTIRQAIKLQVSGFVRKQSSLKILTNAIIRVAAGGSFFDPGIRRLLQRDALDLNDLSPREIETLQLIAEGCRTRDIAFRIGVSFKTVENHRRSLMLKLGMNSIAALTRYAIQCGLIPLESPREL